MNPTKKLLDMAEQYKVAIINQKYTNAILLALDMAYETKKLRDK